MRGFRVAVPLAYLVVLGVAGAFLANLAWTTVTSYRSGYALDRRFEAGPAITNRLLVAVFDGLRTDRAAALPMFSSLAERGASGVVEVGLPSLSSPARASLVTGAMPEVSGVTNNSSYGPPPVQSLFGLAREAGMPTAVYGARFWDRAFGGFIDSYRPLGGGPASYGSDDLVAWQEQSCGEAEEFLGNSAAALRVVGLLAGDEAGHTHGGESRAYREVTAAVDACLGRLVDAVGPETTVVAVSDHGHIHRWGNGGHGGQEPEVIFAPFAMAGPGIRASDPIEARIVDLAPTASVLLGLPIPANSQGRVLWGALELPEGAEAGLRELAGVQREALAEHMPDRDESLAAERSDRVPVVAAAGAWFLVMAVIAVYGQRPVTMAAGLAAFFVGYYVLFYLFQLGYSLSSIVREEFMYWFFARNIGAAALALVAAAACARRFGDLPRGFVLRLSILVTSVLALFVTVTHFRFGLIMEGWMIEVGPGFKAYLDLLAILGIAVGTPVALALDRARRRREALRP